MKSTPGSTPSLTPRPYLHPHRCSHFHGPDPRPPGARHVHPSGRRGPFYSTRTDTDQAGILTERGWNWRDLDHSARTSWWAKTLWRSSPDFLKPRPARTQELDRTTGGRVWSRHGSTGVNSRVSPQLGGLSTCPWGPTGRSLVQTGVGGSDTGWSPPSLGHLGGAGNDSVWEGGVVRETFSFTEQLPFGDTSDDGWGVGGRVGRVGTGGACGDGWGV